MDKLSAVGLPTQPSVPPASVNDAQLHG